MNFTISIANSEDRRRHSDKYIYYNIT